MLRKVSRDVQVSGTPATPGNVVETTLSIVKGSLATAIELEPTLVKNT